MGKIRQINVANTVVAKYPQRFTFGSRPTLTANTSLPKDDTYIAIFTLYQEPYLKALKASKQIKILYESERAYNWNMGAREPRNKVVVFEVTGDGKGS